MRPLTLLTQEKEKILFLVLILFPLIFNAQTSSLSNEDFDINDSIVYFEIMFVNDGTASSSEEVSVIKQVINSLSNKISIIKNARAKYGITIYRDYVNNQDDMGDVVEILVPLTHDINDVYLGIDNFREAEVSSEDFQEAGFDGLMSAITTTDWTNKKPSIKLILWTGESSAHTPNHVKTPNKYSVPQQIDECSQRAVKILGVETACGIDDDKVHLEQIKKLSTGKNITDKGNYVIIELDPAYITNHIDLVNKLLATEIKRLEVLAKLVSK